jgi:hypothetical protein
LVTGRFVLVTGPSVATASEVVLTAICVKKAGGDTSEPTASKARTGCLPATTELVSVDV